MNRIFWPRHVQHVIRKVELPVPATLDPALVEQVGKVLMQVDALRSVQACNFGLGSCDITLGYAQQIFEGATHAIQ